MNMMNVFDLQDQSTSGKLSGVQIQSGTQIFLQVTRSAATSQKSSLSQE